MYGGPTSGGEPASRALRNVPRSQDFEKLLLAAFALNPFVVGEPIPARLLSYLPSVDRTDLSGTIVNFDAPS